MDYLMHKSLNNLILEDGSPLKDLIYLNLREFSREKYAN